MRAAKLRDMSEKELDTKLSDTKKELFNLRFQLAAGQLENTHRLGGLRKEIARILTLREERKLSPEEKKMVREAGKEKKEDRRTKKEEKAELEKKVANKKKEEKTVKEEQKSKKQTKGGGK